MEDVGRRARAPFLRLVGKGWLAYSRTGKQCHYPPATICVSRLRSKLRDTFPNHRYLVVRFDAIAKFWFARTVCSRQYSPGYGGGFAATDCVGANGEFSRQLWSTYRNEFKSHVVED